MGYMCHHAIIVTTSNQEGAKVAHEKAVEIFQAPFGHFKRTCPVSEILASPVNGYYTFLIPPDGSKEGWSDSDTGDERREQFIAWLNSQRYEDNSSPYDWAEIQYGDGDRDNRMLRNNAQNEKQPFVIDAHAEQEQKLIS